MKFCRCPKTTSERKASEAYPELVRAKRNSKNIRHAYDDLPYARQGKTWKNSRNTQYKPVQIA